MFLKPRLPLKTIGFVSIVICIASVAFASEPKIESVSSPIGQRGTEIEIKIQGEGFEGCHDIVFFSPKIRCSSFNVESDYELTALITIDEDCALRNEPFRVHSKFGFSDLRTLRVTPFPVFPESSDGEPTQVDSPDSRTYSGVLEAGDVDLYQVRLTKGQRLSAEVEAVRLGYELLDTVISVAGPDGKLIDRVDDDPLFQQDPVLSIVAENDGVYTLSVHESNYAGSETSVYALHLGDFPRPGVDISCRWQVR